MSAFTYLMEELGDARMRCDQLLRYVDKATKLVEKSSHKDHFFEVAGDLMRGIPETAFKLHKALQAVALAANRIDYEEIKQDLRPEKAEELERVFEDVRVRQVQRRSLPMSLNPGNVVEQLRGLAKQAREEGRLDTERLGTLIAALEAGAPKVASDAGERAAAQLDAMVHALEHPPEDEMPSRVRLAQVLRKTLGEHISVEAREVGFDNQGFDRQAMLEAVPRDPAEVTGALSDFIKYARLVDSTGSAGDYKRMLGNLIGVLNQAQYLTRIFDIEGTGFIQRAVKAIMPYTNLRPMANYASVRAADDDRDAEFNEGKVAAGLYKSVEEEAMTEVATAISALKHLLRGARNPRRARTMVMSALSAIGRLATVLGQDPAIAEAVNRARDILFRKWSMTSVLDNEVSSTLYSPADGPRFASEDAKRSRFEEGKPADPTENMSEDDAKAWKENTEEYGDKFKKSAKGEPLLPPPGLSSFAPMDAAVSIEGVITSLKQLHRLLTATSNMRPGAISLVFKEAITELGAAAWHLNLPDLAAILEKARIKTRVKSVERVAFAGDDEPTSLEGLDALLESLVANARITKTFGGHGNYERMFFNLIKVVGNTKAIADNFEVPGMSLLDRVVKLLVPYAGGSRPMLASGDDDEKLSRFEEGKPADPTENMSEEDAKAWKDNTEEYGDKFKKSVRDRSAFGSRGRDSGMVSDEDWKVAS